IRDPLVTGVQTCALPICALEAIYAAQTPARATLAALHAAQWHAFAASARRVRAMTARGATGLEVGSYAGAFLEAARAAGLAFQEIGRASRRGRGVMWVRE